MKRTNKQLIESWEGQIKKVRSVSIGQGIETSQEKEKRIRRLQGDFVEFSKYYFSQYATAEFADFHKEFANKVITADNIYIVRAWAREHAKSVVAGLLIPMFLMANGKLKNMLLVSHSYDNACELLMPIMANLQYNSLFIADYGVQRGYRNWETGKFITKQGVAFRAIGAGQSPRGTRNEESRPDYVLIDDIDTDEEVRNKQRIDKKWTWIERALYPTMSVSGIKRFVVVGNIIAKDCIITRAKKMADDFKTINILDNEGNPSWKERYSKKDVDYILSKISYSSAQGEYFNNPISAGTIFKEMTYGKVPPLSKFTQLVCYTDPSWKDHKKADFKATVLLGEYQGTFYILKAYVEQTTTDQMIQWHYDLKGWVGDKVPIYFFIEANMLQDFVLDKFREAETKNGILPIRGDYRKKGDKFSRIESLLEPLNRQSRLVLNKKEQNNPHMQRLEEQFISLELGSTSHDDAPDAVEGAVYILNKKRAGNRVVRTGKFKRGRR